MNCLIFYHNNPSNFSCLHECNQDTDCPSERGIFNRCTKVVPKIDVPKKRRCHEFDGFGTEWNVPSNSQGNNSCPQNSSGFATWKCARRGRRFLTEQPDYSSCHNKWVDDVVFNSTRIDGLVKVKIKQM